MIRLYYAAVSTKKEPYDIFQGSSTPFASIASIASIKVKNMKQIKPEQLVCMNEKTGTEPLRIDLVYADAAHPENIFKTALYRPGAQLWLHDILAAIVIDAARRAYREWGAVMVLKDGLRSVNAQKAMQETAAAKANPHWCAPGPARLLSPPGAGGHPRGMAVDATLASLDGTEWDMGTHFDYLTTDPAYNPAARSCRDFSDDVLRARARLEQIFIEAAAACQQDIVLLPSEWWDFRLPAAFSGQFAPLADSDLPPAMRMTDITG